MINVGGACIELIVLGCVLSAPQIALGQAPQAAGRQHTFHGTVQQVNVQAGTAIVNGENVEGWMAAMTMTYKVDDPAIKAFDRRPHGDHNPRHGGDGIFMSADQWHHLEGTFVQPDLFRLYLYDAMTRPLSTAGVSGRIVMADSNGNEVGPSIPLRPTNSPDKSQLEAQLPRTPFPFNVKLFMTFKSGEKEQVFDFTFRSYSVGP